jgi:hypothetical protein
MKMYLDWNVVLALKRNEFTTDVKSKYLNTKKVLFPYSSAHIQEIDNIVAIDEEIRSRRIKEHLDYLSFLTKDLYIYHNLKENTTSFFRAKPEDVLTTIRDVPFAKNIMKTFVDLISHDQKKTIRKSLGVNSQQLNNIKPAEVVTQIDSILKAKENSMGFFELLKKSNDLLSDKMNLGLHNYIGAIFELLDMIGYWKDDEAKNSNYARLWDSNHTYFATYTDYFVSNDVRLRNKAMVVYSIFNISTKIISSNEALEYL